MSSSTDTDHAADNRIRDFEIGARDMMRSEYAPKRMRADRKQEMQRHEPRQDILPPPPPPEPATQEIADNAARYFTLVANLQKERDDLLAANGKLEARIEQFQSRVSELMSQLETSRLETIDANRRTEEVREGATRLKSILENVGGLVADGLQ